MKLLKKSQISQAYITFLSKHTFEIDNYSVIAAPYVFSSYFSFSKNGSLVYQCILHAKTAIF